MAKTRGFVCSVRYLCRWQNKEEARGRRQERHFTAEITLDDKKDRIKKSVNATHFIFFTPLLLPLPLLH